jgi:hypothetical protein
MPSDKISFKNRTHYLVRSEADIATYLNDFVRIDPEAKPAVDAFNLSVSAIVVQLKNRGVEHEAVAYRDPPFTKESAQAWAKRFATLDFMSLVPYCETVDRALVPFMQAYEDAHMGLQAYIKSRVEA